MTYHGLNARRFQSGSAVAASPPKPATSKKNKPLSKSEILKAIVDANGEDISGTLLD